MKLEDQVCSLESARRLKELGFKQDSLFYWQRPMGGMLGGPPNPPQATNWYITNCKRKYLRRKNFRNAQFTLWRNRNLYTLLGWRFRTHLS